MGPIRWVVWRSTSTHESVRAGLIAVRQRAWPSAQDTGKDYRLYGAIPGRIEKRPEARTNIHDKGLRCFNPPSHDATARRPAPYPYRGFGRHIDLRTQVQVLPSNGQVPCGRDNAPQWGNRPHHRISSLSMVHWEESCP